MKILVITQYFYPENLRINDLCFSLKERGHNVTVLTGKPNYPSGSFFKGYSLFNKQYEKIKGISVYRSNLIPRGSSSSIRLFLNYTSFVFFGCLNIFFLKKQFDKILIYAPSPITVGLIGVLASYRFNIKSYLWVHDLWPESVKVAGNLNNKFILNLINLMTKFIYKYNYKILVQSPMFTNYIINQGVPSKKIIYYPYYAEDFYREVKPIDKKINFPKGTNFLFAGNIGIAQSFDTLVDAAKIVTDKINSVNFIILGDGRDKKRILKKIKSYEMEKHFLFLGSFPPEEIPNFISNSDALLIMLKKSEIFSYTIPGKLQSYLACGKPIIGSIDGITSQIISESSSGFVSKAEDSFSLAQSIFKFLDLNFDKRKILGKNARDYYEKEFEKTMLLERLESILLD